MRVKRHGMKKIKGIKETTRGQKNEDANQTEEIKGDKRVKRHWKEKIQEAGNGDEETEREEEVKVKEKTEGMK